MSKGLKYSSNLCPLLWGSPSIIQRLSQIQTAPERTIFNQNQQANRNPRLLLNFNQNQHHSRKYFPPLCQPQWSTSQSTSIQNLPNTHSHPKKNQNPTEPCTPSGLNSISNIYKINSERYENNITKLQSTNGSLWRKTKNIIKLKELIPPIKLPNNKLTISDLEKSNTFAEYFYEVFKPNNINPPINQNKINQSLNSALPTTTPPKHFTPNEIKYTISKLKNGKAPGHDPIANKILKKLTNKTILNITHIFNAMLRLSYFPPLWKISTIILVHKPGKPKNTTSSYRPISLLPSLGKLFEKLLLKRLQNISEINKIIPNSQYGFRAHHSSIHPLHRLTDAISSSLELKKYCSGVFLAIAQAFDKSRVAILEIAGDHQKRSNNRPQSTSHSNAFVKRVPFKPTTTSLVVSKPSSSKSDSCPNCRERHTITDCRKFASLSVEDRNKWARDNRVCYTCLSTNHWANKCHSKLRCATCSKKHHTLLHGFSTHRHSDSAPSSDDAPFCAASTTYRTDDSLAVLLGTALIHIRDHCGTWQTARAIVDSASQISAITVSCVTRLGLRLTNWTAPISGLSGAAVADIRGTVDCVVQPRFATEPQLKTKAWVMPSITSDMPRRSLDTSVKDRFANLALADPTFNIASSVDMLLGADLFAQIMDGRKVTVAADLPTAFSSIFGWILIGPVLQTDVECHASLPVSLTVSIQDLIENFWRAEEPAMPPPSFTDDGRCEEVFVAEHKRLPSGRFAVPLPTRTALSSLSFQVPVNMRSNALKISRNDCRRTPNYESYIPISFPNTYH
ncbi:hypothetical protein QTP88_010014 [Uroleucon formosanum]